MKKKNTLLYKESSDIPMKWYSFTQSKQNTN